MPVTTAVVRRRRPDPLGRVEVVDAEFDRLRKPRVGRTLTPSGSDMPFRTQEVPMLGRSRVPRLRRDVDRAVADIFFEHDRASFGNRLMWLPVILGPVGAAGGVGGVLQ